MKDDVRVSSDSDSDEDDSPDVVEKAKVAADNKNLLPQISKARYENAYMKFMEWRNEKNIKCFSENVLLAYIEELSRQLQPTSLWARYSMLKSTLNIKHGVDTSKYSQVSAFLHKKMEGHKRKKSKTLTADNMETFLTTADDTVYLLAKVALVFGISGGCRKQELKTILPSHVDDTGNRFIVRLADTKTKIDRTFVINEKFYPIVKKYIALRPTRVEHLPFFIKYYNGKCCRQVIGLNKFGSIPKSIAEFLRLPDAKQYTGHCFRRTSITIQADKRGDFLQDKKHGGWQSSPVAEGHIDESIASKTKIARTITSAICSFEPSTSTAFDLPSATNDLPSTSTEVVNWKELNFTEICRCCKRTESGMTSIFDRKAHPSYPPVNEMLRTIASLNVLENNGWPSLVCTSCLAKIQNAYTFILQIIQIEEELSQMQARRKQADNLPQQLPQSTNATNQFTSTDFVMKEENEDIEYLDEPMRNYYQHKSAVNSYENINFVVKSEQGLDAAVGKEPEVKNDQISNPSDPLYHAPHEEKESSSHDDLLIVRNRVDMADYEDIDEMAADEDYQVDVEDGNSIESSDDDSSDSSREMRSKRRKTTANPIDSTAVLSCKVCAYTCAVMSSLKRHLVAHSKNKSFACSKCNLQGLPKFK